MNLEVIFDCLKRGIVDRGEMEKRTGLTRKQVNGALGQLHKSKRIKVKETLTVRGQAFHVFEVNGCFKKHIFDGVNSIFNVGAV